MKQIEDFLHLALKFCLTLLLPEFPFQEKVLPAKYNFLSIYSGLVARNGQIILTGFSDEDF
jgi:hypothetical protein